MFKMNAHMALAFLMSALVFITPTFAAEENYNPVVVELFTSQGCSDAPIVDRLAEELAVTNSDVIVLTCHVDYFNHGAWQDTLSQKFCNDRHRSYDRKLNFLTTLIPQLVMNGTFHTVGQNKEIVMSDLKAAQSEPKLIDINLKLNTNTLEITLPDMALDQRADIWLFGFDNQHRVDIKAGTNEGRTINYINAAKHLVKVLNWKGPSLSYTMDLETVPADGYVVIAQHEREGRIIGVGTVLKEKPINLYPRSLAHDLTVSPSPALRLESVAP